MKALFIMLLATFLTGGAGMGVKGKALGATSSAQPMDCTFTIKGDFNGTVIDVQITVSDVSLIECSLLKLGVKKALK